MAAAILVPRRVALTSAHSRRGDWELRPAVPVRALRRQSAGRGLDALAAVRRRRGRGCWRWHWHWYGHGHGVECRHVRSVHGHAIQRAYVLEGPREGVLLIDPCQMMFGPLKRREDGTAVFATPVGKGHVPMIALADLGFFARYAFDHREDTSGVEMKIASDVVGWDDLARTFEKVAGQRAEVVYQTMDEWFANFDGVDDPVANERDRDGSTTWRENFSGWWALWRDDVISRDLAWVRSVHPNCHTLESWMRENNYSGILRRQQLLKNTEDGKTIRPRRSVIERL